MKRKLYFSASLLTIVVAIVLPGCKKALDELATQEIAQACRIQKIIYTATYEPLDSAMFSYDAYGNPVSAIRSHATTGFPNFLWRYDTRHRLTDQVDVYGVDLASSPFPETWHRFFYDNKGRIAEDSLYVFPSVVDGHPVSGFAGVRIFYYSYDAYDRLISLKFTQDAGNLVTFNFSYDANGNLTGRTYDDKINFRRTNKLWQFLSLDYSVNNPLTATYRYDRLGLPVTIEVIGETRAELIDGFYGDLSFNQATIQYDCR